VTQRSLAEQEGITQSAVSQLLTAAGAASVVEGYRLLEP
jgi:DNA-binding transcriptional regulator LsrR (DeoR family)